MTINEYITEFAGLPVMEFLSPDLEAERLRVLRYRAQREGRPLPERLEPDAAYAAALADPGSVAWRLRTVGPNGKKPFEGCFARFLAEVDTTRVTALVVGSWSEYYEKPDAVPRDLLVESAGRFPALRSLFFGEFVLEESEISWIEQCDVAPLVAAFPALEEFTVRGGMGLEFSAVRHEALTSLTAQTGGLPEEAVAGILASDLPALENLELWLGVEDHGRTTTVDTLAPLLSGTALPALRSLGLRNAERTDDLVRALADAPVLGRLEVLDLSMGTLTDDGARIIADSPGFRGLGRLDLRHHYLAEEGMAERVRAALPGVEVDLGEPQDPGTDDVRDVYYPAVTE
ncbi:STM4015 family protein [Actinorugispora endophytica]|uniref:Leucine rich repeat (LRR) protein n=1 Tax=Actinorugispora endophytica TaxID=1605990 RepID=A0A4R6VAW2_9ACTN|nr:STM4015 family protein [Actinorugispora endophytica]TDQ53787.1 hypothetical protein EV190_103238 [Actinorugispora endophytica]